MLDESQPYSIDGDPNDYLIGSIPSVEDSGTHRVVVTLLKKTGNNSAAAAASHLVRSFPTVTHVLMVGIAGGVPKPDNVEKHVRLGDVVVSIESGVVQYDNRKLAAGKLEIRDTSQPPSAALVGKVKFLEAERIAGRRPWEAHFGRAHKLEGAARPPPNTDRLFAAHDPSMRLRHPKDPLRRRDYPKLHYGRIGSANTLLKDPNARDALSNDLNLRAFEMEGSGITDGTWIAGRSYILVRAVSDYCDLHKNDVWQGYFDIWQGYAAVAAAAYARALIESFPAVRDPGREWVEEKLPAHVPREGRQNLNRPKPIVLPYGTLGTLFKGRDNTMEQLQYSLRRAGHGHATTIVGKALHGLGGVGKTRLAVEYAWQHAGDYSAILFITADTPQALQRNLAGLCGPLALDLAEQRVPEEEPRLAAVVRWLQQNPGWFLILDNVDSNEAAIAAEKCLVNLRGGHVVLTSRLSRWSESVEALELDLLTIEAATDFLLARTNARRRKAPDDLAQAQALAKELGQLSLALEQAGAYIAENRMTFASYLAEWRENHDKVLEWYDERVMQYPRSVAVTWKVSVDLLSAPARRLLERLAWFAPDPIPESVLQIPVLDAEAVEMQTALANLETYSLVTRAPNAPLFSVHRLVQDVTRKSLRDDMGHQALASALRIFKVFPRGSDPQTWPTCSALLPHALATVDHAEALGIELKRTALLLNEVGVYLWARSELVKAEEIHRRVLAICETTFGSDHLAVANSLNNLGLVLWDLADLAGARVAHGKALAIREAWLGTGHPSVAASLNNLGAALWDLAELTEARKAHEKALAILEERLGDGHPAVAASLNNLGAVLCDLGELARARAAHERALAILETAFNVPPDAREDDALRLIHGPEVDIDDLGELAVARAVLDPVLVRGEQPLVGGGPAAFAMSLAVGPGVRTGNPSALAVTSAAKPHQTVAGPEARLGNDHPTMVKILDNLGVVLGNLGELAEAQKIFEHALAIREARLGTDHPDVGWSLSNLGVVLGKLGALPKAREMLERALVIRLARLGGDHPDVATNLSSLGVVLGALGKLPEAQTMLEQALVIRQTRLGSGHPATRRTRDSLATVVTSLGV